MEGQPSFSTTWLFNSQHYLLCSLEVSHDGGNQSLIGLAFAGSIGMTLVVLACALPRFNVWWPFLVVLLYLVAPLPTVLARRYTERTGSSNSSMDYAIFVTMMIVVSSFALPIVLARSPPTQPTIQWGACGLTLAGNAVVFVAYIIFFLAFYHDESDYYIW